MSDNWEVEQKFSLRNKQALLEQLARLGFAHRATEQHCDTYLRHPCRDFRKSDEAFRIRQQGENAVVTYKGPRRDTAVKTRPEIELEIEASQIEQWLFMLEQLGFEPVSEVRKQREVFGGFGNISNVESNSFPAKAVVVIDEVQQVGLFAEVELVVPKVDIDNAQQQINSLAKQLGLTEVEPRSYLSLLLAKLGVE